MTMLFNCLNSKQKQLQKYDPSEIVTSFAMLNRDNSTFYFPMQKLEKEEKLLILKDFMADSDKI